MDDEWCIDESGKTTPDEHGILNNFVEEADLIQLTAKNAVPEAGGLTTTTTAKTPAPAEGTVDATVIKEQQPTLGKDALSDAIAANPGIAIPADLSNFPQVEKKQTASSTEEASTSEPTTAKTTTTAAATSEPKTADSSMSEDDTTLVGLDSAAAETIAAASKGNILPDSEAAQAEHVSTPSSRPTRTNVFQGAYCQLFLFFFFSFGALYFVFFF